MLEKVNEIVTKAASGVAKPGQGAAAAAAPGGRGRGRAGRRRRRRAQERRRRRPEPSRRARRRSWACPRSSCRVASRRRAAPRRARPPSWRSRRSLAEQRRPAAGDAGRCALPLRPRPRQPAATSGSSASAICSSQTNRAPMVTGSTTKRSALVERTLAKMAARLAEAVGPQAGQPRAAGAAQAVGRGGRADRLGGRPGARRADHPREPARSRGAPHLVAGGRIVAGTWGNPPHVRIVASAIC